MTAGAVETSLLEREVSKYRAVWGDDAYRAVSPGARHLGFALDWLRPEPGASFTDWGCGTGRVAEQLYAGGFDVQLVDIAPNAYRGELPFVPACLWSLPEDLPATDYGYCADVMEHIPTEHVNGVLAGIARRTLRRCYFQIALFHDTHFTSHGPLHLSVFPEGWWMDRLHRFFERGVEFKMIRRKHLLAIAEPAS